MRSILALAVAATVVLVMTSAVPAFQREMAAYDAAIVHLCDDRVTPEVQAKYSALVAALDNAKYGYGRAASASNFWGPTSPEQLFQQCHQAGGSDGGSN